MQAEGFWLSRNHKKWLEIRYRVDGQEKTIRVKDEGWVSSSDFR